MNVRILAPAKINLHLDVLDKRPDGYHNLVSLFQSVTLCDTIDIGMVKNGIGCKICGDFPFPEESNIIWKAVHAFLQASGKNVRFLIRVKKRIPIGAGLGGGSSDAGATIACLATLMPGSLSDEKIQDILKTLGSDVPYFYAAPAAIVTGRGENIQSLYPQTGYFLLIVFPGFQVHTQQAYAWLDKDRTGKKIEKKYENEDLINKYTHNSIEKWGFINSFKEVIIKKYPVLHTIISDIYSTGALYANITGSGSALYGIYKEENKAESAYGGLKSKYPFVILSKPLDKRPLPVLQ